MALLVATGSASLVLSFEGQEVGRGVRESTGLSVDLVSVRTKVWVIEARGCAGLRACEPEGLGASPANCLIRLTN